MKRNLKSSLILLPALLLTQIINAQAPVISYTGSPYTPSVGSPIAPITITNTGSAAAENGWSSILAGSTNPGSNNGTGGSASFTNPGALVTDASGNVYVADALNNLIRKITPAGVVTTFAGNGLPGLVNGPALGGAEFNNPYGLAFDAAGNMYVADRNNSVIRKISTTGTVSTLAGSTVGYQDSTNPLSAKFNAPAGVAVDALGNVYVTDCHNNRIRMITPAGVVSTFAGNGTATLANGTGTSASLNQPFGITIDASGNLYVADWYNHAIRKITQGAVVTTLAGTGISGHADGAAASATFYYPAGVAIDANGNIYVADEDNHKIREISVAGTVSTIAGTGSSGSAIGIGTASTFYNPIGIAIDATGFVYVADFNNDMIRKVAVAPYTITPAIGNGLTFNTITGAVTGTPASPTATASTIAAYNTAGMATTILNVNPTITNVNITQNLNYIITYTPRVAGLTTNTAVTNADYDPTQVQTAIQYFDGLGRPIQTVQAKASPTGNDVIQPVAYDDQSREAVKYMPYTVATGTPGFYQSTALIGASGYSNSQQYLFYQQTGQGHINTTYPYAGVNFEPSEENRPVEHGAPGASWQLSTAGVTGGGHTVQTTYTTNNSITWASDPVNSRQVAWYNATVNSDQSRTLVVNIANNFYPANVLSVTVTMDENWTSANGRAGTVETYKDIEGHVVLKREYNNNNGTMQVLSTYYVYDDFGDLAFVLPPALGADAAINFTTTQLCNLGYIYQYDDHGRMSAKKLPGKGWEFMVYNTIDQVVMTQDANQRGQTPQQWTFTKYDGIGRVIVTGMWTFTGSTADNSVTAPSLTEIQWLENFYATTTSPLWENRLNGVNTGYDGNSAPAGQGYTYYTINFYDDYTGLSYFPSTFTTPANASVQTRGLPTATFTNVLGTTNMLTTTQYYDDLGRNIQTYKQHYLGGVLSPNNYDAIYNTYNFTNAPTTVTRKHWNTASTTAPLVTIANTYNYDQLGRKLSTWEQITNGSSVPTAKTLISKISYNEIGQVINKNLHSADSLYYLQNVAYAYNERGWLLTSYAPLFNMALYYNTATSNMYNGNISQQNWITPTTSLLYYTYTYDNLNRLTAGTSAAGNHENGITYDLMGNITALNRYQAGTLTDQLTYSYTGGGNATNQLASVVDNSGSNTGLVNGTTSYTWDKNGNMLGSSNTVNTAQNKSFTYNMLNLPITATFAAGTATYTYDATGNKLRKVDLKSGATTTTDYINGIEYDNSTTTVGFIQTEEGKAVPTSTGGYDYTYYLGDNLGNTRVTFDTKTGTAVALQQDDYYPFGLEINNLTNSPKNEYLYNKKELQEETGLYDYTKRYYDPVIGRFIEVDPLASKYPWYAPYQFAGNEVPNAIDRDGMEPAYPHPDGNYTTARDGQLQRPLTDPDGVAYVNSKTEVGAADKGWDELTEGLNNAGTAFQAVGYGAAEFTDGASLSLVAVGEGFDAAGTVSSVLHDLNKGETGSAMLTAALAVTFKVAGSDLAKAEKAAGLNATQKVVKNAELATLGKATDKAVAAAKETTATSTSTTSTTSTGVKLPTLPALPTTNTMQKDVVKTQQPPLKQ